MMQQLKLTFTLLASLTLIALVATGPEKLIQTLISYAELNIEYSDAFTNGDIHRQKKVLKKIYRMEQKQFLPALKEIEQVFCNQEGNIEILDAYISMLESIGHSASEQPRTTFGKMYLCHPDLVIEAVNNSDPRDQVVGDLLFGFENALYEVDTMNMNVQHLRTKIQELD